LGVLTVGVVTKPFQFEGAKRMRQAEEGVEALQRMVDTLIIIPNQNLFRIANEKTTFTEAFSMADDVLYQGVKGVTDLMVRPGLINLDFADVRAVMDEMGKAMMGTGEASGEDRAIQAAEKAIANPLLDEISLKGARGVLINITGGYDLTLFELDEAANRIREEVDPDANIIVGSTLDTDMAGMMRVSVVATGIDARPVTGDVPMPSHHRSVQAHRAPVAPAAPVDEAPVAARTLTEDVASYGDEAGEPSLFDDIAEPAPEPRYQPPARGYDDEDDLPAPAYRPEPAMEDPIARPKPGTPSPEALARLEAAVRRAPPRETREPAEPVRRAAAPEPEKAARFGINSLINRMTGQAGEGPAPRPAPNARRQPPVVGGAPDDEMSPEQERIEIPAFLRRQAN
jgi:cell division protein FtsZ